MEDNTPSHKERITRLMECYPDAGDQGDIQLVRGNYKLRLFVYHNNLHIQLYNASQSDPFIHEALLNTIPGGNLVDRVTRFKHNWDANHHRLKYDHLLLAMELTRIFSILIPEHMPS